MKISSKIKIAFLAFITVPIILVSICFVVIISAHKESLENYYSIEIDSLSEVFNSTVLIDKISQSAINEVNYLLRADVTIFEEEETLKIINDRFMNKYTFLIVTRDGRKMFVGDNEKANSFTFVLPSYDEIDVTEKMKNYLNVKGIQYIIRAVKFDYLDGSEGVAYIISWSGNQLEEVEILIVELIVIFILILVLAGIVLTLWLHQSIVRPLRAFKRGTKYIAEGNLDFKLIVDEEDEFGELAESFDKMRVRLKESIEANMLYDQESRELISNISHDLKTPMTTILGYAEGLRDGVANSPEKIEKYLKTIYNKTKDMDKLVSELAIYTKFSTNDVPYSFVSVDAEQYFRQFVDEIALEFDTTENTINFINNLQANIRVNIDREQLKRVLNNIVGNSLKYCDKEACILNLTIEDDGEYVKVSVADNGAGMRKEDVPRIFDRFYRTDASRNSTKGGSGIGLAIVKRIIDAHEGNVWADSDLGVGTTIYFTVKKAL